MSNCLKTVELCMIDAALEEHTGSAASRLAWAMEAVCNGAVKITDKMAEAALYAIRKIDGRHPDDNLTINQLMDDSNALAHEKGWYDQGKRNTGEVMLLQVSEICEAFEEVRNGRKMDEIYYDEKDTSKPLGVPIEYADVFIRIADTCKEEGIDLAHAIRVKHRFNESRAYRHGGKKA